MNARLFSLALMAMVITTSCNFFAGKMGEAMKKVGKEQSRIADSLKTVIIQERPGFDTDPAFAAKMDTLYSSGFELASLSDSIQATPENEDLRTAYSTKVNFFRNYVNKNFDYSDQISSLMVTLDMGTKMKKGEKSNAVPFAMDMVYGMVKPSIMQIIILCRAQGNKGSADTDSTSI